MLCPPLLALFEEDWGRGGTSLEEVSQWGGACGFIAEQNFLSAFCFLLHQDGGEEVQLHIPAVIEFSSTMPSSP